MSSAEFSRSMVSVKMLIMLSFEFTLRKHVYSNIQKILTAKISQFSDKNSDIISLLKTGNSNEYPQSMFLSRNKKNNVYPCKPEFSLYKIGV